MIKHPWCWPLCNLLSCHSQSIYRLKKACHGELDEDCNLLTPDQVVDRIFELVDENGDGELMLQFPEQWKVTVLEWLWNMWCISWIHVKVREQTKINSMRCPPRGTLAGWIHRWRAERQVGDEDAADGRQPWRLVERQKTQCKLLRLERELSVDSRTQLCQ